MTLKATNHGDRALPHRLAESSLLVNGVAAAGWPPRLAEPLAPGAAIEVVHVLRDAPPEAELEIEWRLDDVRETARVRLRE